MQDIERTEYFKFLSKNPIKTRGEYGHDIKLALEIGKRNALWFKNNGLSLDCYHVVDNVLYVLYVESYESPLAYVYKPWPLVSSAQVASLLAHHNQGS